MSIKYVVFDWDGTLADTYPVISAAYDYTFDTLGLPRIPYDEVKRITSTLQNKDTLGCIFGERKQEAADAYYSFIGKHHAAALEAMPGARSVLEYCRKHNITSILITNKKTLYVAEEIEKLGFSEFFDQGHCCRRICGRQTAPSGHARRFWREASAGRRNTGFGRRRSRFSNRGNLCA